MSLKGKIAIVTGGSRGIGAAIAIELAKRGAAGVLITYLSNRTAALSTASEIETYGGKAHVLQADILDPESGQRTIQEALTVFQSDHVDIFVNNAITIEFFPFENVTPEIFQKSFNASVLSLILAVQALLPVIRKGGRIINIGSLAERKPGPLAMTLYGSSKAATQKLIKDLALEYGAKLGITINNVSPGPIVTDGLSIVSPEILEQVRNITPAEKRLGQPDDVAQVVAFIAEEGSRWIHGETISVTGGLV